MLAKIFKSRSLFTFIFVLFFVGILGLSFGTKSAENLENTTENYKNTTTIRDKFLWPFSVDSLWNMPIGSKADYVPAHIQPAARLTADNEYYFKLKPNDKRQPVYLPGTWKKRCAGKKAPQGRIPIPDDLIIPDASPGYTPNNTSAFLLPNGKTVVQIGALARCQPGGPLYGWRSGDVDIYGKGIYGAHGSGLSSFGGSIRRQELINDQPIQHALKINIWAKRYYSYTKGPGGGMGYRWPAKRADKYASSQTYGGKIPELMMGSLLAIPPTVSIEDLDLKTKPARKLFYAYQNYGAYLVDDTAWNAHAIPVEKGVSEEFEQFYGYRLTGEQGPFVEDVMTLFSALHVVRNNSADSVGGGGQPRVPLAPPIGN